MAVAGDSPIREADDDSLSRGPIASSFARQVLAMDASEGLVAGVLGPWGSGKTSFVNLARDEFKAGSTAMLDFNPWMFSGAEQLVESFFVELSAELRLRPDLQEIGNRLADYGESFAGLGWLPMVGPWIERGRGAAKVLGKYLRRRREGSQGRREKLRAALDALTQPIVVVLDDIDRLSSPEIRDIFKLVRLTASFPNVIYVVAFDRVRVEQALSEEGIPGRDYLEKILQVGIDLPVVPREVMLREITGTLDRVLADHEVREIDQGVWPDVLIEIVSPLISNMRDVRRYAAAVQATADTIGAQIALADLLAMEAIRVFLPDVYGRVQASVAGLCTPSPGYGGSRYESASHKESVEKLLEASGEQEPVVRALIQRLFPFARRHIENNNYGAEWQKAFLRERRIAHEAILRLYLERVAGSQLRSFTYAEGAWRVLDDAEALDDYLRSVPSGRQQDVIAALESYEDEYQPGQVTAATPVLLNIAADLPERPLGMFDMDTHMVVARVVYRLLRSLDGHEEVEMAVSEILPTLGSLSAKFALLTLVGYRKGAGHKLVSEGAARDFEKRWREEVRNATPGQLANEFDLARVIFWAGKDTGSDEGRFVMPDDPLVTRALLQSARSENRSQGGESRAIRRTPVFAWSTLEELYGDEQTLLARIEDLKQSSVEIETSLAELIDKYLGGWRPKDFDFDEDDD